MGGPPLGQSQLLSLVHRCIWFGTGNNVQFNARADTARRTLHICLLSQEQNPEKRTGFRYPTWPARSCGNAGDTSPTALTLLRAYQVAKPTLNLKLKPWGSFEEWSEIVRGTIVFAGPRRPHRGARPPTRIADNSASSLANPHLGWRELCTSHDVEGCTVRQALEWLAEDVEYKRTSPGHTIRFNTLRDALVELCNTCCRPAPRCEAARLCAAGFRAAS